MIENKHKIALSFNRVNYHNHGFDPDTVRFILVGYDDSTYGKVITDAYRWGISILRVNEFDYALESTMVIGAWLVGGPEEAVMFNIKYKNLVILENNAHDMETCMKYARMRIRARGKIRRSIGVDYMQVISRLPNVMRARERHAGIFHKK